MSEFQNPKGKREASGGSPNWWTRHRAWVAGLDRGQRIRYRVCQVLLVIAILIIALALFLKSWIQLPDVPEPPVNSNIDPVTNSSQSESMTGDLSYEGAELPDVAKSGRKEGYYTFLLCGRDVVSGATDTMMLITYDTQGKSINAISLLRDTMINTSASSKRLNTVFARNQGDRSLPDGERVANGMAALRQEVSRLTGVYPDFYVLVEWEAIGRLVDAIGGVEFEVPFDMDYDDDTPGQDLHIHQKAGLRLLDGQDAMEVIRFRKNNDESIKLGDLGRTQIQRDFLTATLKKCLTPEILLKLPALAQIFTENVNTDLTVGNILAFAQLAVGMDTEENISFASLPCYGIKYNGASMVCAIQNELLEILNSGINPYLNDIKSSDLQLMYQKSGGGFGVTNASLADPAVAYVPKPEEPDKKDDPDETDDPDTPEDPDDPNIPGTDPDNPGQQEPGGSSQPGETTDPANIGTIDPADIFPNQEIQNRGEEQSQDITQAVA